MLAMLNTFVARKLSSPKHSIVAQTQILSSEPTYGTIGIGIVPVFVGYHHGSSDPKA
eukprot:m.168728 g.168728  ORF g.168728 m.168728 type:complete len:57 (+) comp16655_c0_seq2:159-329(+)